jgi:hypothetical protein
MKRLEPPDPHDPQQVREAAEGWFLAKGLPWFVDAEHERVQALLVRGRLTQIVLLAALLAVAFGVGSGWLSGQASSGAAVSATVVGLVLFGWSLWRLRFGPVLVWALRRTRSQLGLLVPLVTRALPLLLLFLVVMFINTEVWQVASSLPVGVLWLTVLLFAALAVLFLVARLPEEVDRVLGEVDDERDGVALRRAVAGTPVEEACARLLEDLSSEQRAELRVPLGRLQRLNLMLVLLVVQATQVLLLALAVFAFFTVFGVVAVRPEIVESWLGHEPTGGSLSTQLVQVSIFLAAFSGLYFTVYAITDETYRRQFFTQITTELEHAVGVRAVYRALR